MASTEAQARQLALTIRDHGLGLLQLKEHTPCTLLSGLVMIGVASAVDTWRLSLHLSDYWWFASMGLGLLAVLFQGHLWRPVARRKIARWAAPLEAHFTSVLVECGLLATAIVEDAPQQAAATSESSHVVSDIACCLRLQPDLKRLNKSLLQLTRNYHQLCLEAGLEPFPPGYKPSFTSALAFIVPSTWHVILVITLGNILCNEDAKP